MITSAALDLISVERPLMPREENSATDWRGHFTRANWEGAVSPSEQMQEPVWVTVVTAVALW